MNIVRTASVLEAALERVLKPAGLTVAQYNVLRILRGAQPEGLCRNEVRDRMLTRMPDMTRLLDRMEAAGLVTRTRSDHDRRVVTTQLSDEGRRLLDQLDDDIFAEHKERLGHLDQAQLRQLIDLLTAVRRSC